MTFFFSLHQDLFHHSFLGNYLARISFLFRMRWKGPDIHTSIFSLSLYPSCLLHSSLYPTRLFPQEKAFVREKWNWVNTSKLCSQESTAMHTKPKEVLGVCLCVRKRERKSLCLHDLTFVSHSVSSHPCPASSRLSMYWSKPLGKEECVYMVWVCVSVVSQCVFQISLVWEWIICSYFRFPHLLMSCCFCWFFS